MKRIVFDIEATGLSEAQICQLSYLIVDDSGVVGKNQFFAVDDMNPDAEAVHGFSMEMLEELSGGLRFADLAIRPSRYEAAQNSHVLHHEPLHFRCEPKDEGEHWAAQAAKAD